ncbi:hypothetical protein BC940DRAFT_333924 [Gongronella butleri]|nr:hypothetical protein BC940DRAFT_333924 [Gongronella butleri]
MCGRFACALCPTELQAKLHEDGLPVQEEWVDGDKFYSRYNVAPRSFVPVVRAMGNSYKLQAMKWGFVPSFATKLPENQPINARDDTLEAGSPMFDKAKLTQRCIVVADGFYEWKKHDNGKKTPYFTKRKDGQLMLFGALYAEAHPSDWPEPVLYSTTIVTTSPSKFFEFLHDRMPLILDPKDALRWLDHSQSWQKDILPMIKPYQGDLLCYQVTDKVGPTKANSPDFVVPVDQLKGSISNFFGKSTGKPAPAATKHDDATSKPKPANLPPSTATSKEKTAPAKRTSPASSPASLPPAKKTKANAPAGNASIKSFFTKK